MLTLEFRCLELFSSLVTGHSDLIFCRCFVREQNVADLRQRLNPFFRKDYCQNNRPQFQDAIGNGLEVFAELAHGDAGLAQETPETVNVTGLFVQLAVHGLEFAQQPAFVFVGEEAAAADQIA